MQSQKTVILLEEEIKALEEKGMIAEVRHERIGK